ncbi:hypothetical protein M4951_17345 [Blastopirellula sp. J2-11]|uniref:hypothetical protein n=1 Tax=Blastopirellula sp. J2-11 TaxID=2943192 RepID=UPI0021C993F4|nr:hypothetical protein [Blastopirellula sp. J2-11]UUO05141.1 hypothetical protein M4951_17345 [Blastopirellula sp. J2-11]
MVSTQFRSQFQKVGRWVVLGVSVVALTVAFVVPSICGFSSDSASTDVAWRGRVYRRAYYGPVVRPVVPVVPVYRAPLLRTYYAPVYGPAYYGSPYGGAVVSPYGGVYW